MKDIKEVTLNELVESVVKAKEAIEELEGNEKMLKDEIQDRLVAMKITGTKCGNWLVSRVKRLSFPDVTMSQAEELGAISKKIDQDKLRKLLAKGIKLKFKQIEFLLIREAKNDKV